MTAYGNRVVFTLTDGDLALLDAQAKLFGATRNSVARDIIRKWLKKTIQSTTDQHGPAAAGSTKP